MLIIVAVSTASINVFGLIIYSTSSEATLTVKPAPEAENEAVSVRGILNPPPEPLKNIPAEELAWSSVILSVFVETELLTVAKLSLTIAKLSLTFSKLALNKAKLALVA
jgi:hypothetical protein